MLLFSQVEQERAAAFVRIVKSVYARPVELRSRGEHRCGRAVAQADAAARGIEADRAHEGPQGRRLEDADVRHHDFVGEARREGRLVGANRGEASKTSQTCTNPVNQERVGWKERVG